MAGINSLLVPLPSLITAPLNDDRQAGVQCRSSADSGSEINFSPILLYPLNFTVYWNLCLKGKKWFAFYCICRSLILKLFCLFWLRRSTKGRCLSEMSKSPTRKAIRGGETEAEWNVCQVEFGVWRWCADVTAHLLSVCLEHIGVADTRSPQVQPTLKVLAGFLVKCVFLCKSFEGTKCASP